MRKLLITLAIIGMTLFGFAPAVSANVGPHGSNDFGLCTAFHAGSATGKFQKRQSPPLAAVGNLDREISGQFGTCGSAPDPGPPPPPPVVL